MEPDVIDILEYPKIIEKIKGYCSFSGGREIIEALLPSSSFLKIQQDLDYTKYALDCTNGYGSMPFYGIREIRPALALVSKGGIIGITDLQNIAQHNSGVKSCIAYLAKVECSTGSIDELVSSLSTFDDLANDINRCITADGCIADNATSTLARIRKRIGESQKELDKETKKYLNAHSSDLMDNITATRNDRQVVLAKTSFKNQLGGIQYGESTSGNAIYLEPGELVPFNNALADLKQQEAREIEQILRSLSIKVSKVAPQLSANMDTLSLLDAIFAKAQFGREVNGVVAQLSKDDDLIINYAWHPLLDINKAVRNTYRLCNPYRILLITGPNTGGKTVTLKTIGLFALLTYAGIPVSAEKAIIPFYDQIFVDIGDSQSITESLSTFSAHTAKLADIFAKADAHSLVLIDELCSGTDPKEGENLAIAVLEHFRKQEVFFIGSTHYGKLKSYASEHNDVLIASMAFDLEKLEPTFKYREGLIGQSNAFDIAGRYGFPSDIILRAKKLHDDDQTEQEKLLEKLTVQQQVNEQLTNELRISLDNAQRQENKYTKELQKLQNTSQEYLENAKAQAEQLVQEKLDEADKIIQELKEMNDYQMPKTIEIKHRLSSLGDLEEENEIVDKQDFKIGDVVRITRSNQIGTIQSISHKQVTIDVRGITVRTSPDGIRKEKVLPKEKEKKTNYYITGSSFPSEINLIGLRVSEAIPALDRYLDQAILHHCAFVRVIHGFGTGILKKAVWEHLKKDKNVESYELAGPSEGSGGATIVHFKKG